MAQYSNQSNEVIDLCLTDISANQERVTMYSGIFRAANLDMELSITGFFRNPVASILGVGSMISDTIRLIWMKLWGYIEFYLKLCNVIFSTSGLDLETGNWNFTKIRL